MLSCVGESYGVGAESCPESQCGIVGEGESEELDDVADGECAGTGVCVDVVFVAESGVAGVVVDDECSCGSSPCSGACSELFLVGCVYADGEVEGGDGFGSDGEALVSGECRHGHGGGPFEVTVDDVDVRFGVIRFECQCECHGASDGVGVGVPVGENTDGGVGVGCEGGADGGGD